MRHIKYYALLIIVSMPHYTMAAPLCKNPVAKVVSVQGTLDRQAFGKQDWQHINAEEMICPGDKVHTEKWSRATLILSNESLMTMDQSTTLDFSDPEESAPPWLLRLMSGSVFFRSRQPQRLNIQTPFINAVHKGTEFVVAVDDQQTKISVLDGAVAAENANGKVLINKGYTGIGQKNQAPRLQALTVSPQDAVQWTLYYPPIIDLQDPHTSTSSHLKTTVTAYQQGNAQLALAQLAAIPDNARDANYHILKCSLLLTVGQVDEAQASLQLARNSQHNPSAVLALQAIIAVAKNQPQDALSYAEQAVTLNPNSAEAKIALSYAQQSLAHIEPSLLAAEQATQLAPENALAWARLAELQLSTGQQDAALIAAEKAYSLNPKLASTQTILGFADLGQVKTDAARQAFDLAIALDPANPLPRLGLALAKIRKGELEAGKKDLETAVSLDPNSAIMRSYLGKAYYELRNKDFASTELTIAKAMDPKDPTPWFYDAILKQTTNRPIEALQDMETAIELNDNRAVYRSSLLLDKDLAARSAAQARIYNDLGFQQRGLLEGWKSVNQDATNYSAHRLLADSYAALPRHDIARVSELLQSQLLQPVNINPIQANLAETNLFILNSLGPTDLSVNEYNPLFEYNRYAFQATGLYGGNNTKADNVTFSGLRDNLSFNLGQFHYQTDGFRDNNALKKDLYSVFVQDRITDDLNLQAEFRHEEIEKGDLSQNFYSNIFSNTLKIKNNIQTYRLGGLYQLNPHSSLIGSLIYQNINNNNQYLSKDPDVHANDKRHGFISGLQHHFVYSNLNMLNGFGHINQSSTTKFFGNDPDTFTDTRNSITNIYNYSKFNFSEHFRVTLGLNIDFLNNTNTAYTENPKYNKSFVHPKLGFEWMPLSSTTLRMAAFRTMSFTRTANQTLEPTQVAGFNQLFDDVDETLAWRYGLGLDHKFSKTVAVGAEYSERALNLPGPGYITNNRSEQLGRAYIYYTPKNYLAFGSEYYYERINQPNNSLNSTSGEFKLSETHRIPLTLSFFHPTGFSFKLKNTFVHQTGSFRYSYNEDPPNNDDSSNFLIMDLNLSYRIPKRYGIINFGINNVLNNNFKYQNTNNDSNDILFTPSRLIYSKFTLAF